MPLLKAPQFNDEPPQVTEMKTANVSQPEDRHITRPARNLPFLMTGDFLEVKNHDQKTWDFVWDRRHYPVEPGGVSFVPFEALVDYLGDPRSQDDIVTKYMDGDGNKGIVMARYAELSRLFARYAIEDQSLDALVIAAPKVEVKTLTGQPVTFPCQRPDMLPWPTPMVDPHAVNSDTSQMIDRVAAENAELRDQIATLEKRMDTVLATREGVDTGV